MLGPILDEAVRAIVLRIEQPLTLTAGTKLRGNRLVIGKLWALGLIVRGRPKDVLRRPLKLGLGLIKQQKLKQLRRTALQAIFEDVDLTHETDPLGRLAQTG